MRTPYGTCFRHFCRRPLVLGLAMSLIAPHIHTPIELSRLRHPRPMHDDANTLFFLFLTPSAADLIPTLQQTIEHGRAGLPNPDPNTPAPTPAPTPSPTPSPTTAPSPSTGDVSPLYCILRRCHQQYHVTTLLPCRHA